MANPIDKLIIQIEADTKQLKKELKQIEGKIKTTGAAGGAAFGMTAGGLGAKLKTLAGPVAIGAVVVGITKMASTIAQVGSQFEDLKDSLDTVFGSMEAGDEAMQRVFKFAQTTPFQIETATKAFIALKSAGVEPSNRMLQVFADTASTSTDQLGVFEALVRTVQRSASGGLGLEELNMIMDRGIDVLGILNSELGLTKDSIATFGKTAEGAKLITDALINGLEQKFGGAMESKMDNLSTVTSNMTIAFKQLGDEVFKSGLGDFFKEMASSLTSMANAISKAIGVSGGRATAVEFVEPEFTPRADLMKQRKIEAEQENLNRILDRRIQLQNDNIKLNDILDFQYERGSKIRRMLDEGIIKNETSYNDMKDAIARNNSELTILSDKEQDIIHIQRERAKGTKELTKAEKEALDFKGKLMDVTTMLANEFDKLEGNTKELEFAFDNWNEIMSVKINGKTLPELFGGTEKVKELFGELRSKTDDVSQTFSDSLAPAIQSMSLSFTNDFVNALLEGQNAMESFKSFAQNVVSQIIATFLQLAVVNKILNSIFGAGTFDTFTLGKGITKASAGGGSAYGGQPMLVGERGPEIFVPHSNGNIMNNMNSKKAMGGGSPINIYQNLNFATGVVPTVRAEITRMMPQIADVTKAAVQESAMRGGTFRRSLVGG
jgi:hypothetical protein